MKDNDKTVDDIMRLIVVVILFATICLLSAGCSSVQFAPLATVEINDNSNNKQVEATLPLTP